MTAVERSDAHPPVHDWATDFDHTDEAYAADPFPIWDELRTSGCPVAHTERYGGAWLPTTHELVSEIAYDTERFTSRSVVVSPFRPPRRDGARWASRRRSRPTRRSTSRPAACCSPPFSPQAIDKIEPSTRDYCKELIAEMGDRDVVDAAEEYAQHIPVRVIAKMLGFPEEDADRFRGFVNHVLEGVALPLEQRAEGMMVLFEYLREQVEDHLANPRDDLTTFLHQRGDGRRADPARPRRRHHRPAAPRRHRHHLERDRRVDLPPRRHPGRPRARSSPSPSCCPPRWRSCSAPTPPSPWPAW